MGENYHNAKVIETTKNWSYQTIHTILNNETYVGNLVQNRVNTLSYKDKKKKVLPKEKWIVVKSTHEPIIEQEVFDKVQKMQKIRTRSMKSTEENGIFSGMLFCADCKHAMSRKYARRGDRGFIGYICKTYKTQGKSQCPSHSIDVEDLECAVLQSIKNEASKILCKEDIDELQRMQIYQDSVCCYEMQLEEIQRQIDKIQRFRKKTYDNFMEDLISKEEYKKYVAEYDKELEELKQQKMVVSEKSDLQQELDSQYDEWVEAFKDYINIETLTREVVLELIDKIEVHEDNAIDIYYRFQNPYEK